MSVFEERRRAYARKLVVDHGFAIDEAANLTCDVFGGEPGPLEAALSRPAPHLWTDGYALNDPKHPTFHERYADLADTGDLW